MLLMLEYPRQRPSKLMRVTAQADRDALTVAGAWDYS
jgi:hypothetical protein